VSLNLGRRQPGSAEQRDQEVLEHAVGWRAADVVLGEQRLDLRDRRTGGIALELIVDCCEVEDLHLLGLVEGTLELAAGEHLGQVEPRPRHARARDRIDDAEILWREGCRAVDVDPRCRLRERPGIVTSISLPPLRINPRSTPTRAMREPGIWTAGENRSHEQSVADKKLLRYKRVDTSMNAVKAADFRPLLNRPRC